MSEIRVDSIKAEDGISSPSFPNGIQVTGVVTATSLASSVPHLNVGSNIQLGASGVTTATSFSGTTGTFGDFVDVGSNIKLGNAGVVTATTFVGALTGNPTGTLQTAAQPNITSVGTLSSLNVSGSVSIGGTLTYEDVTNIDSVGIVTARLGVRVPDNVYSYFGTGNDLSIRHDAAGGNHSYIFNTGAGVLKIGSNTQFLIGKTTNATYIEANPDGDVKLYHNNSSKLATTSTGVTVTGTVSDSKGDLRKIIHKQESSAYTLVAADAGKAIEIASGGITVPSSVFAAGDAVTIINDSSSAQTITKGSGLNMFNSADATNANRTLGGRGMATIYFVNSSTSYISGAGLS